MRLGDVVNLETGAYLSLDQYGWLNGTPPPTIAGGLPRFNGYLPDRETTPDLRSIAVQSLPRLQAEATNAFNLPLLGPTLSSLLTCRFLHL